MADLNSVWGLRAEARAAAVSSAGKLMTLEAANAASELFTRLADFLDRLTGDAALQRAAQAMAELNDVDWSTADNQAEWVDEARAARAAMVGPDP